jgi:CRISPR-associated endonuclease/helicase Cas3
LAEFSDNPEDYEKARWQFMTHIEDQKQKASTFQISRPYTNGNLIGWLDAGVKEDRSGKRGEATVRDAGDSIEILVVQRLANGRVYLLPWVDKGGSELPLDSVPAPEIARAASRCSVKLPSLFSAPGAIDKTITELEKGNCAILPECWQQSGWLRGELFLVLDDDFRVELGGHILQYSRENGLSIEEEAYGH